MSLPSGLPQLEYLKKQAKALLKAFRAADPQARKRVETHLPRFVAPSLSRPRVRSFVLADALHIIACESGFSSWMKLKAHVETLERERLSATGPDHLLGSLEAVEGKSPALQPLPPDALARQLAAQGAQRDVLGLVQSFSSMPLRVMLGARKLLVEQGSQGVVVEGLLEGLQHPSPRVRYGCAHALDHFADERSIEPLRRLLDDPVPRVRRVALHVLSCDTCKIAPLQREEELVDRVITHALSDPSINVRRHATMALGSFCNDSRADLALKTLLAQESDRTIQREARRALRGR